MTSAGATTPDSDTTGAPRQIYAPPTTTCSAQPRLVTHAPIRQTTTLKAPVAFYQRSLQTAAPSLPAVTQTTSAYQPVAATGSLPTPSQGVIPQRLTYDYTPQQPPPDPCATSMPFGPYGLHYYVQGNVQQHPAVQYQQQQQQVLLRS